MAISQISDNEENRINLQNTVGVLLDYKKAAFVVTLLTLVVVYINLKLTMPEYQADALVQIESRTAGVAGIERLADLSGKDSDASTEMELIKSRYVLGKVVDALDLTAEAYPIRYPIIGDYKAQQFGTKSGKVSDVPRSVKWLPYASEYDWGGAQIHVADIDVATDLIGRPFTLIAGKDGAYDLFNYYGDKLLLSGVVGERVEKDGIILLIDKLASNPGTHFRVSKKQQVQTINSVRGRLNATEKGRRTGIIALTLKGPDLEKAKIVLDEISNQYVYQNIARTSAEAANSLKFVREQLPRARAEMDQATTALNAYQVSSKSVDINTETKTVLDQLVKLDISYSDLKLKQVDLASRFTREHPSYQILLNQMSELEAKKRALEDKVEALPETQQVVFRLQRDVEVSVKVYTQLLNKEQELDIVRAGTVGNARIIDKAEGRMIGSSNGLIMMLAFIGGILLSACIAWVHVLLTRGVENPDDIEKLGLMVNAIIPYSALQVQSERGRTKSSMLPLLSVTHPTDPSMEAIRTLRTSIYFIIQEAKNNIVMISGPSPLVGKTFVSANLAVSLAQAGKKILVIDGDMRKGYMHCYFDVSKKNTGLANVLQKKLALKDALVHTEIDGLDFISRGQAPDNPSELLMSPVFSQMLKQLSENYDFIIIDTPPIMAVADALIVSKLAGSNFIVSRFSINPIGEVRATIKQFESNGVKLSGAILNAAQKRSLAKYGYQKYAYGNYTYNYNYNYNKNEDADKPEGFAEKILAKKNALLRGKKNS